MCVEPIWKYVARVFAHGFVAWWHEARERFVESPRRTVGTDYGAVWYCALRYCTDLAPCTGDEPVSTHGVQQKTVRSGTVVVSYRVPR